MLLDKKPQPLGNKSYALIDVETNGLPDEHPDVGIVEIAMVVVNAGFEPVASVSCVINPDRWPPPEVRADAMAVHRLRREWLEAYGAPADIQDEMRHLLATAPPDFMLAWNSRFECELLARFLGETYDEVVLRFSPVVGTKERPVLLPVRGCVRSLAALALNSPDPAADPPLLPNGRRAGLARVAARLGIPPAPVAHRALPDALHAAAVMRRVLPLLVIP
jgi:DNA polymerase III epsilon subunit-like protein